MLTIATSRNGWFERGVFCRRPYGAPALQGLSCADFTVFSGDDFWKPVSHLDTRSDHVDWLPRSRVHACLFPAHRYTTFEMASEKALVGLCLRIALAEQAQAIARSGRVKFLILDEVLSSLDDERCDAVQRIFADVQKRGIFEHIIMITHLDSVKQGWHANGLVVQKVDGKMSTVISVSPGEVPMDLAEVIEV